METFMKKRFLTLILALSCVASLVACGVEKTQTTDQETIDLTETSQTMNQEIVDLAETSQTLDQETYILPQTLENPDLVIVWDMTEDTWKENLEKDPNAFNLVWTTKEAFEEKYGGHVEVIGVGWGDMMNQTISMVNAGEVCDLVQAHDQNFPI